MPDPTPDEILENRLILALADINPEVHGPALKRVVGAVVDDLPPGLLGDLLRILEAPAAAQRRLEQRLRDERYGPHPTTTSEGLTRAALRVVEDPNL
jgi:hypothetical protein